MALPRPSWHNPCPFGGLGQLSVQLGSLSRGVHFCNSAGAWRLTFLICKVEMVLGFTSQAAGKIKEGVAR